MNIPKEEVETITDKINRKEYHEMFAFADNYDVQATRREAMEKGLAEGKEKGLAQGLAEGKEKGLAEGLAKGLIKGKIEGAINLIKELNLPLSKAMSIIKLQENTRDQLITELKRENIIFTE